VELAFVLIGLAFQAVGIYITIKGAQIVWRDVAKPEDRFLAPEIRWIRALQRRLKSLGYRLFRRTPPPQIIQVGGASATGSVGTATVSVGFQPIDTSLSIQEQIVEVDRRARFAMDSLYAQSQQLDKKFTDRILNLTEDHKKLETAVDTYTETERQHAVHGLRIEARGFILLTVGSLIQAVASIISALN